MTLNNELELLAKTATGISYDSRNIEQGDVFFCIVGEKCDGHLYAQSAVDNGASTIVSERPLYLADTSEANVIIVSDTKRAMAEFSSLFYDSPSKCMSVVGITGTNGKTTTTYLVEEIAKSLGNKTGVIGTVGIKIGEDVRPATMTTPPSPEFQKALSEMRNANCKVVTTEVSSHALSLHRCDYTDFAVTAFTNLTQDHLDYHKTFSEYFAAKSRLFTSDFPAKRVINIGNQYGRELAERCITNGDIVYTYDSKEKSIMANLPLGNATPINLLSAKFSTRGTKVEVRIGENEYSFSYPLIGSFNVENVMCAIGICLGLGYETEEIIGVIENLSAPAGRMERVSISDADNLPAIYVDYAHTPDALDKAIETIHECIHDGKLIVVFGCGGDRDKTKRPIMGKSALAANYAIVTSDNPRTENPEDILKDIVVGMIDDDASEIESFRKFEVMPDRRDAIRRAVALASENDCVLIAGKGHEGYQIVGTEKHHFDDREEAREALTMKVHEELEEYMFRDGEENI